MHDRREMLHFGQEAPGWTVVALLWNLERRQSLAGKAGEWSEHGGAELWLDRGEIVENR